MTNYMTSDLIKGATFVLVSGDDPVEFLSTDEMRGGFPVIHMLWDELPDDLINRYGDEADPILIDPDKLKPVLQRLRGLLKKKAREQLKEQQNAKRTATTKAG